MPRQIASTGLSASIAAVTIASSIASCSGTMPYSDSSVASCPYRRRIDVAATVEHDRIDAAQQRRDVVDQTRDRWQHQWDPAGALDGSEVRLAGGEGLAAHALGLARLAADDDDERIHLDSVRPRLADELVVDRLLLRLAGGGVLGVPLQPDHPRLGRQLHRLELTILGVTDRHEPVAQLADPLVVHGVAVIEMRVADDLGDDRPLDELHRVLAHPVLVVADVLHEACRRARC